MTPRTLLVFLIVYAAVTLAAAATALIADRRRGFAVVLAVLALVGIVGAMAIGAGLDAGASFAGDVFAELSRLSRTYVVAALLGVSCAVPLAVLLFGFDGSRSRLLAPTLVALGFCGTLLFGVATAAKDLISPYLPMPDTAFATGALGRLTPPEFSDEEFLDTNVIPVRVAVSPSGRVFVSGHIGIAAQEGVVVELSELPGGDVKETIVARQLNRPYGLIATDNALYVSRSGQHSKWSDGRSEQISTGAVTELRDLDGDGEMDYYDDIVSDLPGAKGPDYLHQNNGIALGPDGSLYITTANHADGHPVGDARAGAILKASGKEFSELEIYATGLRNPFGLAFDAQGDLYATDNDAQTGNLGGNLGDKLLRVSEGDFFGHPYAPDTAPGVTPPLLRSAYALGGLTLATSERLPQSYRNHLFVVIYGEGRIMRVVLESDQDGEVRLEPFAVVPGAVDIAAAPNGDFYIGVYPDKVVRLRLDEPAS